MSEIPTAQLATDLIETLRTLLTERKYDQTFDAINDNKYSVCLKDNSWDLIPVLTNHLDHETWTKEPELFTCCERLLETVATKSNPEEALLEFIEQAELSKDDTKFLSVLNALKLTLLKLKSKRGRSLEWCLNTIQQHVTEIPPPGDYNLEQNEKLLMDSDSGVGRIVKFYSDLIPFYSQFVQEVALPESDAKNQQHRELLICFLLKLFDKPFACLDFEFEFESKGKNASRLCAEKIMHYLKQLIGNGYRFLEYAVDRKSDGMELSQDEAIKDIFASETNVPTLSFGVYYYLILSENVEANIPKVYDPLYLFQSVFYLVADLLHHSEQFIIRKGLLLAHSLICSDLIVTLPYQTLDARAHSLFCKNLTNIMIYSDVKSYRELCLKIFKTYLFKFDTKGRYLLILNLMETIKHINTRGYLISQYKDMLRELFQQDSNKIPEHFSGTKLYRMLDLFCLLPEGSETDLMDHGDQIITTLNLLIYLTIRDKYNATGIWNHIESLQQSFFKPLKQGLIVSKAHYELKINELKNGPQKGEGDTKLSVSVGGRYLPAIPVAEQLKILDLALNNFGALEMLLARVEELIEDGPVV